MYLVAGSPGAGKTTQCQILQKQLGFIWISAGALLRKHARGKIKDELDKGELVDDQYVEDLISKEISQHAEATDSKILLDAFPRDLPEARWLLEDYGAHVQGYILLDVPEEVAISRLAKRDRSDDTPRAIKERLTIFRRETEHIIEYFEHQAVSVYRVDGSQTVDKVQQDIRAILGLESNL